MALMENVARSGKCWPGIRWQRPTFAASILAATLTLAACGAVAAAPSSGATQADGSTADVRTNEAGSVTMVIVLKGVAAGPTFSVTMDTHSVDLDSYDLSALAALRTDNGREVRPIAWNAPNGGHHRSGELVFPATAPDGLPVIQADTRMIELLVRDVAGVPERSFQWELR